MGDGEIMRKSENEKYSAKSKKLTAKGQKRRWQSAVSTKQGEIAAVTVSE
jgi:hypothetical protein